MPPRRGKLKLSGSSGGAIRGGGVCRVLIYSSTCMGGFVPQPHLRRQTGRKGRDPPTAAATPGTNNNNKHAPATAVKG